MATGIVLDFTSDLHNAGHVKVDETGEILPYSDRNFPNTGLNLNDPCTFDIFPDPMNPGSYVATNLQKIGVVPPTNITQPFNGNVTSNPGDVITISGAAAVVTGNLIINGGKIIVEQSAQVNGNAHQLNDGALVARQGGLIKGGINVDNGGNLKVVNKGKIVGPINVNMGGRMIVGNDNGPGFITGTIDILKIRRFDITGDSKING
ncbi:MAG TPA: hypothetical protein VNZ49_09550 [Bacteroidia bacterium]|nr:hypothetical protein [Bacteroidia bacterium]